MNQHHRKIQRYLVPVEYIGTRFFGFQKQLTDRTITGVLEDAGVHALSNVCHVDIERISKRMPGGVLQPHEPAVVRRAVNHFLQLALLASYSGDELVAIYRYFCSLAVDNPFTTARENLIVAFEKNRQSFSQLPGDAKVLAVKESSARPTGKGRGKVEAKLSTKAASVDTSPRIEGASSI